MSSTAEGIGVCDMSSSLHAQGPGLDEAVAHGTWEPCWRSSSSSTTHTAHTPLHTPLYTALHTTHSLALYARARDYVTGKDPCCTRFLGCPLCLLPTDTPRKSKADASSHWDTGISTVGYRNPSVEK